LNKYPKLRSVLQFGLKNFNNVAVEWVPGAVPTAYFYDATGAQTSELVLGDRSLTELISLFKDNSFTPTVETQPYSDPLATREYGGHTYTFFNTENPLTFAVEKAKSLGGYIVTVTSSLEQDFLAKVLGELQMARAWLGASDESEEGQWKWTDGPEKDVLFYSHHPENPVNVGYSHWFKGEPNNADGENCANVFPDGWNDVSCLTEKNGLIVEIGQDPLVEPPLPPTPEEPALVEEKSDL